MTYRIGKIWGNTTPLLRTPLFELHKVEANAGCFCSKHKHAFKWNGFYTTRGRLKIKVWAADYDLVDETTLNEGDFTTVEPGVYHMFLAETDCSFLEVYYLEPLAEDIIRETVGGIGERPR